MSIPTSLQALWDTTALFFWGLPQHQKKNGWLHYESTCSWQSSATQLVDILKPGVLAVVLKELNHLSIAATGSDAKTIFKAAFMNLTD